MKLINFHQMEKEIIICCGMDALRILEIQQEGKKRMGTEEFLRGFTFI